MLSSTPLSMMSDDPKEDCATAAGLARERLRAIAVGTAPAAIQRERRLDFLERDAVSRMKLSFSLFSVDAITDCLTYFTVTPGEFPAPQGPPIGVRLPVINRDVQFFTVCRPRRIKGYTSRCDPGPPATGLQSALKFKFNLRVFTVTHRRIRIVSRTDNG